jgi:putative membrane protein
MWLMPVGGLVFLAAVVVSVVYAARYLLGGSAPAARPDSPERIIAERFARGEISADEYRERLRTLHDTTPHP